MMRAACGARSSVGWLMAEQVETGTAGAEDSGDRLDRVLATRVALSRPRLKALILTGEVAIGGRTIRDPGYRVNAGEVVSVSVPPPEPAVPQAEAIPLAIVYEDDDVIVIDKIGRAHV